MKNDNNTHFFDDLKADMTANGLNTSTFMACVKNYLVHPTIRMLASYRLQKKIGNHSVLRRRVQRILWMGNCRHYACHINPIAKLEPGVRFPHPTGIVIGEGVTLKKGATIYQNVTLGIRKEGLPEGDDAGPTVEENAILYAGAVVIGKITVGKNATVGANSVVTKNVEQGITVSGNPATVITKTKNQSKKAS